MVPGNLFCGKHHKSSSACASLVFNPLAYNVLLVVDYREGLNVRAGQSDSAQVSIEMGQGYDLDTEIEGLRSDVGQLKQVSCTDSGFLSSCFRLPT